MLRITTTPCPRGEDTPAFGQVEIFLGLSQASTKLAALLSTMVVPFFHSVLDFKEDKLVPRDSPDWARPDHSLSSDSILQSLIFEIYFASSQKEMQESCD